MTAGNAVDDQTLGRVVERLLAGKTTVEAAREPCEHGMRYRGTSNLCGYCLALGDFAIDGWNDHLAKTAPARRD